MAPQRDLYEVLGVARDASDADVKKAFRKLARELHPDVSDDPQAESRFREVAEAYEVLADADSRARYDRYGHEGLRGTPLHTEQFMDASFLSDLFGAFFGGGDPFGASAGPRAGSDASVDATITLEQAAFGHKLELELALVSACERCAGSGAEPPSQPETCETCGGRGQVQHVAQSAFGRMVRTAACPDCDGRGRIARNPCRECRGRGRSPQEREISVAVPAGIDDGQQIRVTGRGHAGEAGARPGDLYVRVHVQEDARFARDGLDLVAAVDLTFAEAALGCTKDIPTLEGSSSLEFKPGTQPGDTRELRGHGMPSLNGGRRGSLRVLVNVRVPRSLSKEQRTLLERYAASETEANYGDGGGLRDAIRRAFG
jgi:molecular chaperone DnaJ